MEQIALSVNKERQNRVNGAENHGKDKRLVQILSCVSRW